MIWRLLRACSDAPARAGTTRHPRHFASRGCGTAPQLLIRGFGVRVPGGAPALDLGFYQSQVIFMRPVRPGFPPVLAPCLLGGRMLGPGWLAHFRRIGLDHPIGVPSDAVTERDNRRWRLAAGLASWSSFRVAMESGAAWGRTSAPPEPAVLAGRESPRGADPGQGHS